MRFFLEASPSTQYNTCNKVVLNISATVRMPTTNKNSTLITSDYPGLLTQIRKTLLDGQRKLEAERVRIYWQTGRLIHAHILKHRDRAKYGAEVFKRLAKDLTLNERVLQQCVQFVRTYPRFPIPNGRSEFTWSHYRALMRIDDDAKRSLVEEKVARNDWSAEELSMRIKETRSPKFAPPALKLDKPDRRPLVPLRGAVYTYRLVERPTLGRGEDSGLLLDLGFGIFREVEAKSVSAFAKDDIVESIRRDDGSYRLARTGRTAKDLFTYNAQIERVVDGDTVKVRFDLGFGLWTRQTLRLRGLDCPEMDTKAGQEAKTFAQAHLKDAAWVIVESSRSDKYDRYLADIFMPQGEESNPATDVYLNNLLLERGLAVRMG